MLPALQVLPRDSQHGAEVSLEEPQLQRPRASAEVTGGPPMNTFLPERPGPATRPAGHWANAASQRQKHETVPCSRCGGGTVGVRGPPGGLGANS